MSTRTVVCTHCGAKLEAKNSAAQQFRCPKCDKTSPMPPSPSPAPTAPPVALAPAPAAPSALNQSTIRTVVISVVATLVVLGGGWFAWSAYTDHQNTEKTREVSASVRESMQTKFSSDSDLSKYGIKVQSVDLIRISDTKYDGMATVTTSKSSLEHQVKIDVTADGEHTMWQAAPGAMMFLIQE